MARVKVTSSDINARLAKGECANYLNGSCHGRTPCTIVSGEACQYFNDYVRPLLDMPEFSQRYAREAKIKLALNPNAKVVRKRRAADIPALALDTPAQANKTEKPAPTPAGTRKAAPAATARPAKVKKVQLELAAPKTVTPPPAPVEAAQTPKRGRKAVVQDPEPIAVTKPVPARAKAVSAPTPESPKPVKVKEQPRAAAPAKPESQPQPAAAAKPKPAAVEKPKQAVEAKPKAVQAKAAVLQLVSTEQEPAAKTRKTDRQANAAPQPAPAAPTPPAKRATKKAAAAQAAPQLDLF